MRIIKLLISLFLCSFFLSIPQVSLAAIKNRSEPIPYFPKENRRKKIKTFRNFNTKTQTPRKKRFSPPVFDFPVTYNHAVKNWIKHFQTRGKRSFKTWLERSSRYAPYIQKELEKNDIPQDLLYVAMIESGFSPRAHSSANAVGIWQFIAPTARRYGLKVNWWVDERKNFTKATHAAIRYKKDLYKMFHSWHLVSASYNTGENRIARLIKKHGTNSFWELAEKKTLSNETINYVPKIIAATLIARSPALYGFKDLKYRVPYRFEETEVPGGTDLNNLAQYIGVKKKYLKDLNPDLIKGFIPREINTHRIKVPVGSKPLVRQYANLISKTTI